MCAQQSSASADLFSEPTGPSLGNESELERRLQSLNSDMNRRKDAVNVGKHASASQLSHESTAADVIGACSGFDNVSEALDLVDMAFESKPASK